MVRSAQIRVGARILENGNVGFLGSDVQVVIIWLLLWELNPNFQVPVWQVGVYKIIVSVVDD